jgi:L-2-hydroxyglutarate oxidase LhgO
VTNPSSPRPGTADVAVVGGGIVGLATALALVERHRKSVVGLEAASEVGAQQTGHNSGVIHAGLYYRPGSLKATLCRSGLELMYRFCEEEGVPHRRCGKLIVAVARP